jgi:hypothetical protein
MQTFQYHLSRPVNHVNEAAFLSEWQVDKQLNSGPDVDFEFEGSTIRAVLHTSEGSPWPGERFQRAVQIVLHRVDPACHIVAPQA